VKIAEAYVEVTAKTDKAQVQVERDFKSTATRAATAFAGAFAAIKIGQFLGGTIEQAKRLQETVGSTKAVFGQAGGAIDEFAKTSAEGFGLSERAARELTAQIGALLQGFGFTADEAAATSIEIAKLGADLAATFGGNPEDAVLAIGAALRGELDPLERFGVALNAAAIQTKAVEMGLATGKGALDANAKAQATLALITERSASAQGQFAREADTASGAAAIAKAKQEDAAASLGTNFLPVYQRAVQIVGTLAEVFGKLPGPVQIGVVALAGIVALAGPMKAVVDVVKSLGSAATGLGGAFTGMNLVLGSVVAVAGIAAATYLVVQGRKQALKQATNEYVTALEAEAAGQRDALSAAIAKDLSDKELVANAEALGLTTEQLAAVIRGDAVPAYDAFKATLAASQEELGTSKRRTDELGEGYDLSIHKAEGFAGEIDRLTGAMSAAEAQAAINAEVNEALGVSTDEVAAKASTAAVSTVDLTRAEELHAEAAKLSAAATKAVTDAYANAEAAADSLLTAQLSLFNSEIAAREGALQFAAAADASAVASNAAAKAGGNNAQANIAAGQAMDKATTEALQLAAGAAQTADAQAKLEGRTLTAAQSARIQAGTLRDLASKASGPLRDELNRLAGELDKVGAKNPKPTLGLNDQATKPVLAAGGLVVGFGNKSASATLGIRDNATSRIQAIIREAQRFAGQSYVADATLITRSVARATGGPVGPGSYMVGERGPELLTIDARGRGSVRSAGETAREGPGRGGLTINGGIHLGDGASIGDVTEQLDRYWFRARNSR